MDYISDSCGADTQLIFATYRAYILHVVALHIYGACASKNRGTLYAMNGVVYETGRVLS